MVQVKTAAYNRYTELGDFLKTRRNKIKPEQLGLPVRARRRTPGLRREEVAQLAGIGLTWYTWLEQGRPINVSDDVLDSLSRVFVLNDEERVHLYALANKSLPFGKNHYQPVSETLIRILKRFDTSYCPAYIMDSHWNLVAWNDLAITIFGDFSLLPAYERNIVYMMFCNQDYMTLFEDWEFHAKGIMARFHAAMAKHIDDPWFTGFVQDLKNKSDTFSTWWSLYDVNGMSDVIKELKHPLIGKLTFEFVSFDVSNNRNLKLLVHNPDDKTLTCLKEYVS
ncbi:MAG: helix-turn-helix transcriptional regulator [Lachnospiraceae bacterium]